MTDDDVHSALLSWLAGLTAVTVIKSHQSGAVPAGAYIAVNMTGTAPLRVHAQSVEFTDSEPDDDGSPVIAAPVIETEWRFSCHAYGPNPMAVLRPIRSAAQLAQMNEPLMPGLVIHEASEIRNVPDWINEAWEPRAQMNIYVRGLTRDGFVVDVIEEVPLDISAT